MEKIKSNLKERDIDSAVTGSFITARIKAWESDAKWEEKKGRAAHENHRRKQRRR